MRSLLKPRLQFCASHCRTDIAGLGHVQRREGSGAQSWEEQLREQGVPREKEAQEETLALYNFRLSC